MKAFKAFRFLWVALMAIVCVPLMAQTVADVPATDYDAVFASLAAIVAVIPVVVEAVKALIPKLPSWAVQVLSWVIGIAVCMFGWWQELGFLAGQEWYIALLYGLGSGIAANGVADTGLIQWIIGLFAKKKV